MASDPSQALVLSIFNKYDSDHGGSIDRFELKDLCYDLGVYLKDIDLAAAVQILDSNGDGQISFAEFYAWWKSSDKFKRIDAVRLQRMQTATNLFRKWDRNSDGQLDKDEWKGLCGELYGNRFSPEQVEKGFNEVDTSKNGFVDFNEFINWLDWLK